MKVINMSKKRFESLMPLILPNGVISTESIIYNYRYSSEFDGVLKKLYKVDGNLFGSKLYTIEMLDCNRDILPNSFVIPDYLVTVKGEVIGFTIPKIMGDNLSFVLKSNEVSYKDKIYYLKSIGNILKELDNIREYTNLKDIFIGDLQECNFIINPYNRDLYVVDLDSCKISNNIASPSRYLNRHGLLNNTIYKYRVNDGDNSAYIIPDRNSDLYCYNIMVLNYLYGANINNISLVEYYDYLNYLEYIGMDMELLYKFNNLVTSRDNDNIGNYLDTISQENIVRSNNRVYKKVRGRR